MGGIAGMIRFDGQEVRPADINNIAALLGHRGSLATSHIENGVLMTFGGPVETTNDSRVSAVADADVFSSVFPNSPFANHYAQKGPAAFDEPNADFALALWDSNAQTLYCARDILGVKPLYYVHQPNRFFAFASEIKALNVLYEVPVRPNRHKFREYLTWHVTNLPYGAETFYEDVYSVLPGHYLKVSAEKTEEIRYWQPDFQKFYQMGGIEDYSSSFRDIFTSAVTSRTANKKNIGSHLSGGLDSSTVTCIAQSALMQQGRPALNTFKIDTGQPLAEEERFVQDVVNQWHTNHHRVTPLDDVLGSIVKINTIFDRPEQFIMPSSFHLSISNELQRLGCDLILTGHGGDNVATTGFDYLDELMQAGDLSAFKIACEQFYDHNTQRSFAEGESRKVFYDKYMLSLLVRDFRSRYRKEPLFSILSKMREYKRKLNISEKAVIAFVFDKIAKKPVAPTMRTDALTREFKQQITPRAQRSTQGLVNAIRTDQGISLEGIVNHTNVICNEQTNHIGAYYGHQYAFPFYDKNVIELCLATPVNLSFDNGRGRGLIRHGMQGIIPRSVQTRNTKANFIEYGLHAAQQLYNAAWPQMSSPAHPIWEIVDRQVFSGMVSVVFNKRIHGKLKPRYIWQVSRIIYLSIWLDSFGKPRQDNL
ncbi:asparagine synthetase B family protein [Dyadobacter crusticola]|uniref:asparagine synthetase B family protein n=1 Tax=Dyadobacter crusticola TaxID=292407 RepID=UPI0004E283D6|nr:asparagine synthetase B family protein [Dyadobacter crusticola]